MKCVNISCRITDSESDWNEQVQGGLQMEFFLLASGLMIIIFAVVVAVVSSVVSAVAAEQDDKSEYE